MAMQKLPCLDSTSRISTIWCKITRIRVGGRHGHRKKFRRVVCAKTKFAGVCSDVVNPAQCGPPVGLNVQSGTLVEGLVW